MAVDLTAIMAEVAAAQEQALPTPQGLIDLGAIVASVQRRTVGRPGLTILSNGLGRDSATLIALLVKGQLVVDGELVLPTDVDAVVFSDTGYEWSFSYAVIPVLTEMLEKVGVPFYVLRKPPEEAWRPYVEAKRRAFLRAWEQSGGNVKSKAFQRVMKQERVAPPWIKQQWASLAAKAAGGGFHRTAPLMQQFGAYKRMNMRSSPQCTDRHKIQPINHFIEDLTLAKYGVTLTEWGAGVLRGENQPHRVLIGFAADEVKRVERGGKAILTKILVKPHNKGDHVFDRRVTKPQADAERGELKRLGFFYEEGLLEARVPIEDIEVVLAAVERMGFEKVAWHKGRKTHLARGDYRMKLGKVWKRELYPLYEMGITKTDESAILVASKLNWIRKSGCFVCHFQPVDWFWALSVINPPVYQDVLGYEQTARSRNKKWFLKGSKPLDVQVRAWRQANPDATVDAVLDKSYDRCGAFNRRDQAHIPVLMAV